MCIRKIMYLIITLIILLTLKSAFLLRVLHILQINKVVTTSFDFKHQ